MLPTPTTLLAGLDIETFLRDHWQKKPLLVRGALPGFASPIAPDELAGLACEDDVESRIVLRRRKPPHWELRHGPFAEREFAALPTLGWTLLVQDCDKHVPALAAVLDPFRFVPDWRIDDLMISYAVDGGGVGPHVDQYDVFLLQARGRRRWRIAAPGPRWREVEGLELRVLADFEAEQEWTLEPGDMLYLPPGVAHEGTAEGECMTFSIGFRAPNHREMLSDLAEWLYQQVGENDRYADPELGADEAKPAGRIDPLALAKVRNAVRDALAPTDDELDAWFGRFITEPKLHLRPEAPYQPLEPDVLALEVRDGARLRRDPRSRLAWSEHAGALTLFADGQAHPAPGSLRPLLELLCAERAHAPARLARYLEDPLARALLAALYNQGTLAIDEDVADVDEVSDRG
jgi:50S ribosomal protein L16 3-hydroxylase